MINKSTTIYLKRCYFFIAIYTFIIVLAIISLLFFVEIIEAIVLGLVLIFLFYYQFIMKFFLNYPYKIYFDNYLTKIYFINNKTPIQYLKCDYHLAKNFIILKVKENTIFITKSNIDVAKEYKTAQEVFCQLIVYIRIKKNNY